jgi:hypothetical protein
MQREKNQFHVENQLVSFVDGKLQVQKIDYS